MQTRVLGDGGPSVSALGLGTMGMTGGFGLSGIYGATDEAEAMATLHRALEVGVNFFDTAEVYGPYENERLVGRGIATKRDQATIATKFGFRISSEGTIEGLDGSPNNARRAIDESLQRLGLDYVDLWYLHRLDPDVPIEETVGAMAEAVQAGKVRWLGLSEVSAQTLARAHAEHPISALQSEYSIWERNLEAELIPLCQELGVAVVPYCPLGRGFLSGKVGNADELSGSDYRKMDPRFAADNHEQNQRILDSLTEVAKNHDATNAQVALAWLLHRGENVIPIPGTKRRKYLEENAAAAEISLSETELDLLNQCGQSSGERYSPAGMATIDR